MNVFDLPKNLEPALNLDREVRNLRIAMDNILPDAVAFYAGRIVEATVEWIVRVARLTPAGTLLENLDLLALTGRIDDGILSCANAIRRIANETRHLERDIQPSEMPTIVSLAQIWVESLDAAIGPGQGQYMEVAFSEDWSIQTRAMKLLMGGSQEVVNALARQQDALDPFLADAATAAIAGERLIDCLVPGAGDFARAAHEKFPRDRRIVQILGLYYSRTGALDDAIKVLLPLRKGNPKWRNAETLGILGGAYKNKWIETQDRSVLQAAHDTYSLPLPVGPRNYYLLVNAAATALWLGNFAKARATAYETSELLARFGVTSDKALAHNVNYWMLVTLAEAELLGGSAKRALALYDRARQMDVTGGRWMRTSLQLRLHLDALPNLKMRERFDTLIQPGWQATPPSPPVTPL